MPEIFSLTDNHFITTCKQWLLEANDLIVERANTQQRLLFAIATVQQLDNLLLDCDKTDLITIVRGQQFTVRGRVNEKFIQTAISRCTESVAYSIMQPAFYPNPLLQQAIGTGRNTVEHVLSYFMGQNIWFGETINFIAIDDLTIADENNFLFGKKNS
jgi:hypothetical protein